MNLVLPVQKRFTEWVARSRSISDFHARAMNLVLPVKKRLTEWVARSRSRLGFGLSRQGHEPGVAGPKAFY